MAAIRRWRAGKDRHQLNESLAASRRMSRSLNCSMGSADEASYGVVEFPAASADEKTCQWKTHASSMYFCI